MELSSPCRSVVIRQSDSSSTLRRSYLGCLEISAEHSGRISSFDSLALDPVTFRTPKSHCYS
jgi:hypothetical protein